MRLTPHRPSTNIEIPLNLTDSIQESYAGN